MVTQQSQHLDFGAGADDMSDAAEERACCELLQVTWNKAAHGHNREPSTYSMTTGGLICRRCHSPRITEVDAGSLPKPFCALHHCWKDA